MTENYRSCSTHCCPIHGCKYGLDGCPVKSREVAPEYPPNNGCEPCEMDAEDLKRIMTDGIAKDIAKLLTPEVKDKIVAESTTFQALIEERDTLRAEIKRLKGDAGPFDVPILVFTRVEDGGDYGDAASIAKMAIRIALRKQGTTNPETGTTELTITNASGSYGPVKIAKIRELNEGGYDTGLIHRPSIEPYRFWDLTSEQIEEMNRESMGG
jgi:hypothetical protein